LAAAMAWTSVVPATMSLLMLLSLLVWLSL
jgi:hypothetical protein